MPRDGGAIDLAGLERLLGYRVHILSYLMAQRFFARFGEDDMTPGVYSTLLAIRDNPGVRHGTLADALMIQRPNMTKLVNALVRAGQVRRRGARDDQRSVELFLTPQGERALQRIEARMETHEDALAAGLSARERKTLHLLLAKLAARLRAD